MKYSTKVGNAGEFKTGCLIVTPARARTIFRSTKHRDYIERVTENSAHGKTVVLALPDKIEHVLVVGADEKTQSERNFRKNVEAAAKSLAQIPVPDAVWHLNDIDVANHDVYWKTRNALSALSSALYRFDEHKSKPEKISHPRRVSIHVDRRARTNTLRAIRHAQALDAGLELAKNLGNQPPNICNPVYLAREGRKFGRLPKTSVRVLDEKQMQTMGMGAFMSVTRGSENPGKMIIVRYNGGRRGDAPIAFIGKGITFDSGGISLKSGAGMDEMKFDMAGAASVLGAMRAAIDAQLPLNIMCIVAAAENMPSGKASRPGDIVTTYSGKTVEILNTDAEGRLVLCDAISYAKTLKPAVIIDVATLTGACVVALGSHASALYSNDDALTHSLEVAGQYIQDRVWPMPLWDEYQQQLSSPFADMSNIGGREAGSITAACFLSRFAESVKWAHLDIAGTAYRSGTRKGSTGRPVPLLFQYLINQLP